MTVDLTAKCIAQYKLDQNGASTLVVDSRDNYNAIAAAETVGKMTFTPYYCSRLTCGLSWRRPKEYEVKSCPRCGNKNIVKGKENENRNQEVKEQSMVL